METKNDTLENTIFPVGRKSSAGWFTGSAWVTPLLDRDKNNDFSIVNVVFEPGARTKWHTHPKGQVLLVTGGSGFYQEKGKPAQTLQKGDVINIPENVEHWRGASKDRYLQHIGISNYQGEESVTWLEPVTEKEYKSVAE